jgi:hypothetical protein
LSFFEVSLSAILLGGSIAIAIGDTFSAVSLSIIAILLDSIINNPGTEISGLSNHSLFPGLIRGLDLHRDGFEDNTFEAKAREVRGQGQIGSRPGRGQN